MYSRRTFLTTRECDARTRRATISRSRRERTRDRATSPVQPARWARERPRTRSDGEDGALLHELVLRHSRYRSVVAEERQDPLPGACSSSRTSRRRATLILSPLRAGSCLEGLRARGRALTPPSRRPPSSPGSRQRRQDYPDAHAEGRAPGAAPAHAVPHVRGARPFTIHPPGEPDASPKARGRTRAAPSRPPAPPRSRSPPALSPRRAPRVPPAIAGSNLRSPAIAAPSAPCFARQRTSTIAKRLSRWMTTRLSPPRLTDPARRKNVLTTSRRSCRSVRSSSRRSTWVVTRWRAACGRITTPRLTPSCFWSTPWTRSVSSSPRRSSTRCSATTPSAPFRSSSSATRSTFPRELGGGAQALPGTHQLHHRQGEGAPGIPQHAPHRGVHVLGGASDGVRRRVQVALPVHQVRRGERRTRARRGRKEERGEI